MSSEGDSDAALMISVGPVGASLILADNANIHSGFLLQRLPPGFAAADPSCRHTARCSSEGHMDRKASIGRKLVGASTGKIGSSEGQLMVSVSSRSCAIAIRLRG